MMFGQRRFASRRLTALVFGLLLFAITIFLFTPTPAISQPPITDATTDQAARPEPKPGSKSGFKYTVTDIKDGIKDTLTKSVFNPFREPGHAPQRQKQDTYKGTSWWANWQWLSVPFSSSVTLDEDRALLPPLPMRPYIYCYYDSTHKGSTDEKDAESSLLLTWRRAWWAQGFIPIILTPTEAMSNPKYSELQRLKVDTNLKNDLMKWFAWESMGAGILADYTVFPMAPVDDSLLTFLRQGEYPKLTRWSGFDSGLLAGSGVEVDKILKALLQSSSLETGKDVISILGTEAFDVDKTPKSLAYYSSDTIKKNYAAVSEKFTASKAKGLRSLVELVSAHLQMTWQSQFSDGIEVLKPFPGHTTVMVQPALDLAKRLGACPKNPVAKSCPPNVGRCNHCIEGQMAIKMTFPTQYRNTSRVFSIGTVPHPWTLATLNNLKEDINVTWIRQESPRDPWLEAITQKILNPGVSGYLRVLRFKQAVADEGAATRALWITPETDIPSDIDWQFGFALQTAEGIAASEEIKEENAEEENAKKYKAEEAKDREEKAKESKSKDGKSKASKRAGKEKSDDKSDDKSEGKSKGTPKDSKDEKEDSDKESEEVAEPVPLSAADLQAKEEALLADAKRVVNLNKLTDETRILGSLEAWNLADTEAWKFARAYLARRRKVRSEWEDQESKYAGGVGSEKGRNAWNRWRDEKEESK